MNQATLDLTPLSTGPTGHSGPAGRTGPNAQAAANHPADRTGFELGWDHAHHGLVPPAELLLDGTPVGQGWRAGKAMFGRRNPATTRPLRLWLQLRTEAWLRSVVFDSEQVTPRFLAQIAATHCPVTRRRLGGAPGSPDAPVIVRLHHELGYVAGNLAVLSQRAASAAGCCDRASALRHARSAEAATTAAVGGLTAASAPTLDGLTAASPPAVDGLPAASPPTIDGLTAASPLTIDGLTAAEWTRLALLMSFKTPLSHGEAARLPLRALPPPRVQPLNAVQGLQVLLTLQLTTPGWSQRLRALAALLPDPTLRTDLHLLVGALAPRLLEAGARAEPRATRLALEDAWIDPRVNRRWQHFVLQLGAEGTATLLQRASAVAGRMGLREAASGARHAAGDPAFAAASAPSLRDRDPSDAENAHRAAASTRRAVRLSRPTDRPATPACC